MAVWTHPTSDQLEGLWLGRRICSWLLRMYFASVSVTTLHFSQVACHPGRAFSDARTSHQLTEYPPCSDQHLNNIYQTFSKEIPGLPSRLVSVQGYIGTAGREVCKRTSNKADANLDISRFQINQGRREALSTDVGSLKKTVPLWCAAVPPLCAKDKSRRGINTDSTGGYICSSPFDWKNDA